MQLCMGLLDNSAHIDDYVRSIMTVESALFRCLNFKQKMPCARKGSTQTRLDSLCTFSAENFESIDTPVHIHVHMVLIAIV